MGGQAALVKRRAALPMAARKAVVLISPTLGLKTGRQAHPYSVHIQCHLCFILSFLEF